MTFLNDAPAVKSGEVLGYGDEPVKRYVEGLRTITKADELRAYLAQWPFLAADAIEQARDLTDANVQDMQKSRMQEGEDAVRAVALYGFILIPTRTLVLTEMSQQFHVPTGAAYCRLWETGTHDEHMALEGTDA